MANVIPRTYRRDLHARVRLFGYNWLSTSRTVLMGKRVETHIFGLHIGSFAIYWSNPFHDR